MSAKPLPHYVTLGLSVWMTRGDGEYFAVPFMTDRIPEGGIEELLASFLSDAAEQGMFPVSMEQYAYIARMAVKSHQREELAGMFTSEQVKPEKYRAFLETYMGRADGDA